MIPKKIDSYYKFHSGFYNLTRWAFLFGRNSLKKSFPRLPEKSTILDLGCGTGKQLQALVDTYPRASIIGIDRSSEMLNKIPTKTVTRLKLRNEVYSKKSFPPRIFDLILASYSITMVDDIEETLCDIQYHLKDDGILLVVDFDSSPFQWFRTWMKKNHVKMEPSVFTLLKKIFPNSKIIAKKGYFGLYTYSFFIVDNDHQNLISFT